MSFTSATPARRTPLGWTWHLAAAVSFALGALVNAWGWLMADRMPPGDFPGYAAQVQYVRDALLDHGRVPLWCVECYGGTTNFTGNLKEYVTFPLALFFEPVLATKAAFLLLRIGAALGLYALVIRWFASPMAGIAAGYAYGFGAIANYQLEYLDAALSAALLPLILVVALALLARGGARCAVALGVLAACQLANNGVHAVTVPAAISLLMGFRPWRASAAIAVCSEPGRLARRWAIGVALAVFVAFAASGLAWIAADAHNHRLIPAEVAAAERARFVSRSPFVFFNRANALGSWLAEHHPPGFDLAALDADRRYVGVVVLALIAMGSVAARRDPELWRWAGVAGSALLLQYWLSLGPRTLLWEVAESFHAPADQQAWVSAVLRAIAAACVLAACGFGLAAGVSRRDARAARIRIGFWLGGALLAFFPTASLWSGCAQALPWLETQRSPGHFFDTAYLWIALLFALALVALQRRFAGRRLALWITAAAAAAVIADFWPSRNIFSAGVPMKQLRRAGETVRTLPGEDGTLRMVVGVPRHAVSPTASWIAAQGSAGHAWGWLPWQAGAHWADLIDSAVVQPQSVVATLPLFEAARVRYWFRPKGTPPLPLPWRRVRSEPAFAIWEQPLVSPIAAGFREVWYADASDDIPAMVVRARGPNALVVSGADAERFATDASVELFRNAAPVTVTYHRPEPEHIALDVAAGALPAMIFASEGYHPWWRAAVDGAPAPVLRAQVAMLAVPVGPGTHRIDLRLERPGLVAAADRVTALSWIALAIGAPIALLRSRQGKR